MTGAEEVSKVNVIVQANVSSEHETSISTVTSSNTKISEAAEREGFSNTVEFLLTSLGFAVGLGNIWRFPTRAYENGGSAFLIPYITCAIVFGLPALYLEFAAGQHQGASSPILFRRIMPILEGVGWMGAVVASCVAVYYIVIIAWIIIYIFNLFRGHTNHWSKCTNEWNDNRTCIDVFTQKFCRGSKPFEWNMSIPIPPRLVYINGKCHDARDFEHLVTGTEQYFTLNILKSSSGLFDFNGINLQTLLAMTFCWILTGLLILKGVKFMGKISYVTVIIPFILVVILFIRGVTLDGSDEGLRYYFGRPDFSKIFTQKSWADALKQLCFSLSAGHGGLMNMASYNDRKSNCFKNALTIIVADTIMSVIGGGAVFATLGFLAKQRNVPLPEVVDSGLSLAFVVYPEAISQMPIPFLWSFLFFSMLLLLGLSTEMALVEVFCTCICDQFNFLRQHTWMVVSAWCTTLYLIGILFSTNAGFYWFELFDEYSAGFAAVITIVAETVVIAHVYGGKNFVEDIKEMDSEPKSFFSKYLGGHSPFFLYNWMGFIPAIGFVLVVLSFIRDYPYKDDGVKYPPMFDVFGWILAFLPLIVFLLFCLINYHRFTKKGFSTKTLFMLQKQHVSFSRISKKWSSEKKAMVRLLPDHEPWDIANQENVFVEPEVASPDPSTAQGILAV